jgi:hypothetical protein
VQDSRCEEDEPTLGAREVLDWCNGSGLGVGGSVAGAVQEGRVQALVECRERGRVEAWVRRLQLRQLLAGHLRYPRPTARRTGVAPLRHGTGRARMCGSWKSRRSSPQLSLLAALPTRVCHEKITGKVSMAKG